MDILNFMYDNAVIFFIIILIEGVLSIDNAAVLSGIVNRTLSDPIEQKKVFTYGMIGAFTFRGLSIFGIHWLLERPMLGYGFMLLGGAYLVYLFASSFAEKDESHDEEPTWLETKLASIGITKFWLAVISVEFMDIVFSIDNMVAVVGMSKNIWVIIVAVCVGILMMRAVAIWFTKLIKTYPALEQAAMWVVFLVGLKLLVSSVTGFALVFDFQKEDAEVVKGVLESHTTDLVFSVIMLIIFAIPFISKFISVSLNKPTIEELPEPCKPVLRGLQSMSDIDSKVLTPNEKLLEELRETDILHADKEWDVNDAGTGYIIVDKEEVPIIAIDGTEPTFKPTEDRKDITDSVAELPPLTLPIVPDEEKGIILPIQTPDTETAIVNFKVKSLEDDWTEEEKSEMKKAVAYILDKPKETTTKKRRSRPTKAVRDARKLEGAKEVEKTLDDSQRKPRKKRNSGENKTK